RKTRFPSALPAYTASREIGDTSSASMPRSCSSTPNDRWSPSSAEKTSTTQSTPGARISGLTTDSSQAKWKMQRARTAKTSAERNAVRVRNSIARSLRATRSAAAKVPGGRRAADASSVAGMLIRDRSYRGAHRRRRPWRGTPVEQERPVEAEVVARVDAGRVVPPDDPAGDHHRSLRCDREALVDVMRHQHERRPGGAQTMQHLRERGAADRVEARVRLVEQHDARLVDDRPSDRDALLKAAAQLLDGRVGPVGDLHALQGATRRVAHVRHAVEPRRELHVLARRERAVEHALVRDEPDQRARLRVVAQRPAGDRHRSGGRLEQTRDQPEQRRLPRAIGPKERQAVAGRKRQIDAVDGEAAAKASTDRRNLYRRWGRGHDPKISIRALLAARAQTYFA